MGAVGHEQRIEKILTTIEGFIACLESEGYAVLSGSQSGCRNDDVIINWLPVRFLIIY